MEGGWIQIPLKTGHQGPTSEMPLNGVTLACRWWPNIENWLGSFVIFQGIWTSIAKKPYILWFFDGWGVPLWIRSFFSVIKVADQPSNYPQHGFSHWTSTDIKCRSKRMFLLFNIPVEQIENVSEPPNPCDQAYPFAYGCSFTLHTSYKIGMLGQGDREAVKMLKTNYYKSLLVTNFVQIGSFISIYFVMYTVCI